MVSNNVANIVAAIKLIWWAHILFAHNITLTIQYGLEEIKDLQTKTKAIVKFFKKCSQACKKLKKKMHIYMGAPVLCAKQDVTGWNSSYVCSGLAN